MGIYRDFVWSMCVAPADVERTSFLLMWTFLKISLRQFISLAARKFTTSRRRHCHISLISPAHCGEKSRSQFEGAIKWTQVCRKHPAKRFAMTLCNDKHCRKHSSGSETRENVNLKREAGWPSRRRQFLCLFNREMINSWVFMTGVVNERKSKCAVV